MACSCKGKATTKFRWTDGTSVVIYDFEIQAKAKVLRKGGSYTEVPA